MTKTLKIFVIAFIGVILAVPYLSQAQTDELKSALGEVLEGGTHIETKDVGARKSVLLKIINLAVLEATELKKSLKSFSNLEGEYLKLKKQHLEELDGYINYYKSLKKQLSGEFNLEQMTAFGNDFKVWREVNYDLNVKKIVNFVLAFQQDNALKIAEKRYVKTLKDVQKSKLVSVKTEALRILSEVQADLKEARVFTNSAEELLLPLEKEIVELTSVTSTMAVATETSTTKKTTETSTETSLVATSTPSLVSTLSATSTEIGALIEGATSTEAVLIEKADVKKIIEKALTKTKEAYQKFFQISALITKNSL